jgi:hypothetical protein
MSMPPVLHSALWLRGYRILEFRNSPYNDSHDTENPEMLNPDSSRSLDTRLADQRLLLCQEIANCDVNIQGPYLWNPDAPIHDPWDLLPRVPAEING